VPLSARVPAILTLADTDDKVPFEYLKFPELAADPDSVPRFQLFHALLLYGIVGLAILTFIFLVPSPEMGAEFTVAITSS
jgi:hypothetical protein